MPTYDYICDVCNTEYTLQHSFKHKIEKCIDVTEDNEYIERILFVSDTERLAYCSGTIHKIYKTQTVSSQFKGTGFYQTDYKNK